MNSSTVKPKALIITSWAPPMVGGPQNLYNLCSQFPRDHYVILTSFRATHDPLTAKGTWLEGEYTYYDRRLPFKWITNQVQQGMKPMKDGAQNSSSQSASGVNKLLMFFTTPFKIVLMTRAGIMVVRQRGISIIVGISDHGPALIATALVAKLTHRPYVFYLYDLYRGNNFSRLDRLLARVFEGWLLRGAQNVIVTNEGTSRFLQKRYGKRIRVEVVHNSVFPKLYEHQRTPYEPQPPYTLLFTGHVYWAQEQAVLNLIEAMKKLNDLPVRLSLYCPKPTERLRAATASMNNVELTSASQSEMPKIQSAAALLLLPLAWNTKAPDIIATATPGKFTDYLASGRPMLVHAPDYAYVSQYTKEHKLGLVVDTNDVDFLARTIRDFLSDPKKHGQRVITNALAVFEVNHDAVKNAVKLRRLLGV